MPTRLTFVNGEKVYVDPDIDAVHEALTRAGETGGRVKFGENAQAIYINPEHVLYMQPQDERRGGPF
jgi:hypothetical protein